LENEDFGEKLKERWGVQEKKVTFDRMDSQGGPK
jgi:hypothetical protein